LAETTLTFIGTGGFQPKADNDTACLLVNGHCLIDCGWNAAINMTRFAHTVLDVDHVIITHCHHDHYLGLAGVIFLRRLRQGDAADAEPLRIIGPQADIARVVKLARDYMQMDDFERLCGVHPEVVEVGPGDGTTIGELTLRTAPTMHSVEGLACRLRDERTGIEIGFSGDTAYSPSLAEHFHGVDVLVYEASWGLTEPEPEADQGHSAVRQSAAVARDARVGKLYLVHTDMDCGDQVLAAAREVFPETYWPEPGMTLHLA